LGAIFILGESDVSGGVTTYQILSNYKRFTRPICRDDGKCVLRDVCSASFAVANGHALSAIEDHFGQESGQVSRSFSSPATRST
jgi:hypothetical protein